MRGVHLGVTARWAGGARMSARKGEGMWWASATFDGERHCQGSDWMQSHFFAAAVWDSLAVAVAVVVAAAAVAVVVAAAAPVSHGAADAPVEDAAAACAALHRFPPPGAAHLQQAGVAEGSGPCAGRSER